MQEGLNESILWEVRLFQSTRDTAENDDNDDDDEEDGGWR
jgi:hypothetical protein